MKDRPSTAQQIKRIALIVVVILAVAGAYRAFNLADRLKNIGYRTPAEIVTLSDKIQLTSRAKVIFNATRPQLDDRDAINEHCKSNDIHISILGCYIDDTIYLYNIHSTELDGVVESTAAHELLHAVWARLNFWEKSNLQDELLSVYQQHYALLAGDMELYDDEDKLDELHSRVGVEIKDLPEKLESHYAKYFIDQDSVVAFYDAYSEPFKRLSAEIDALSAELEIMHSNIDAQTADYYQQAESLSARIDEFNNCASTIGCFTDEAEFYAQRNQLVAEQEALMAVYEELNTQVEAYNQKVEQHNNNILHTQTLENAINSNAPPDAI